jgi:hypothetical protein
MKRILLVSCVTLATLALLPAPARADATAFWGLNLTPHDRAAQGISLGFGLLVVGAEFEYAGAKTDTTNGSPSLTTASFNGIVQTPTSGFQLYATAGGGVFREQLLDQRETAGRFVAADHEADAHAAQSACPTVAGSHDPGPGPGGGWLRRDLGLPLCAADGMAAGGRLLS